MSFAKNTSFCFFLAVATSGAIYYHFPDLLRKYLPAKWHKALHLPIAGYTGDGVAANDWADPAALQNKLRQQIDSRLTGTSPEAVKEFLKDPQNRLILAQHSMAHSDETAAPARQTTNESYDRTLQDLKKQLEESTDNLPQGAPVPPKIAARNERIKSRINAIEREMAAPHSMSELTKNKKKADLMSQITGNLDWMQQINNSGEEVDPAAALSILGKIVEKDPNILYNQIERDTATATALEFSKSSWAQSDAVDRAMFYIKNHREGRLNKVFDTLPLWQRRIVCGLKGKGEALGAGGNDSAGSKPSLEYSLDNVHLPAYRYTGSCWQAPYRAHNIYGESIHGPHYHETFSENYGGNFNEQTRTVGGVCGGLSHYGATTATANGIPALTSGEPGHCSYAVLVGDTWTPAYSLSWQRGMHWQVFSGNNKFSALNMATKLFSPEEKEKTELSQAMQRLGNTYAAADPAKAKEHFSNAVETQPLNYYAWRDYAKFLTQSAPNDAEAWVTLCEQLQSSMAPSHAEMAAELMKAHVYPGLKKALADKPDALKSAVLSFWRNVKSMGPDADWDKGFHGRWDVEGMAQAQMNLLGINPNQTEAVKDFFRTFMGSVANKPDYAPVALAWGNTLLEKMDKSKQSDFLTTMINSMGGTDEPGIERRSAANTPASDEQREAMLRSVLLAAEKTEDIRSFQAIGKALPEKYLNPQGNDKLPRIEPMPDKLVSQGGLIVASSTSGHDQPCRHWGVLEPGVGGSFHTGRDTDAWVKVVLPKQANITGVVIQTTTGNLWRLNNMVIQVSENGNDWKDVHTIEKCDNQTLRVDLKASAPLAKYVRIMRKGGPEFFHLRAIYVYGKPAA